MDPFANPEPCKGCSSLCPDRQAVLGDRGMKVGPSAGKINPGNAAKRPIGAGEMLRLVEQGE